MRKSRRNVTAPFTERKSNRNITINSSTSNISQFFFFNMLKSVGQKSVRKEILLERK